MRKAHRVFQRVTNGLNLSEVDFGAGLPAVRITPTVGRNAARNIDLVLAAPDKPYQEVGSIEGYIHGAALDGFGRHVVYLVDRITGDEVKCLVTNEARPELESREIRDIWRYRRIQVSGRVHFHGPGRIDYVEAQHVRFLRNREDLPQIDDVIDPDFTGGMKSEEYLERLRDGTLS